MDGLSKPEPKPLLLDRSPSLVIEGCPEGELYSVMSIVPNNILMYKYTTSGSVAS